MQVDALKALSIKLINTATFVYQLYRIQTGASGDTITSMKTTGSFQVILEPLPCRQLVIIYPTHHLASSKFVSACQSSNFALRACLHLHHVLVLCIFSSAPVVAMLRGRVAHCILQFL